MTMYIIYIIFHFVVSLLHSGFQKKKKRKVTSNMFIVKARIQWVLTSIIVFHQIGFNYKYLSYCQSFNS